MVGIVKEICIFMIIAQAIMFFVPGSSYVKYVRILVGIIMILRITEPIFGLFLNEEKQQEIGEKIRIMEEQIQAGSMEMEMEDTQKAVYEEMEQEIKEQLEGCEGSYQVTGVDLTEHDTTGKITLTVTERTQEGGKEIRIAPVSLGEHEETENKEEELKNLYGNCIGMDEEQICILFQ